MNTVTTTHYELGKEMTLVPVNDFYGRTLKPGDIIEWRGAYPSRSVIISKIEDKGRVQFKCIRLNGLGRHTVDAHMIKREDDKALWHTQHYFLVGAMVDIEIEAIKLQADEKAREEKEKTEQANRERNEQLKRGTDFHARNFPWARSFIVAERIVDDSDPMTDYFAEHGEGMIVLAPSKHERNNFAEMRKAAELIPETAHLGQGKNRYTPVVIATEDNREFSVWKGSRSHWHDELTRDENGKPLTFSTVEEINEWMAKQVQPCTVNGIPFALSYNEEQAEHREDYSGGKGLYLQLSGSPWRVYKMNSYSSLIREGVLIALGSGRVDHLEARTHKGQPKPTEQAEQVEGVTVTRNIEKDGVEIRFPARPSEETCEALKANGFRWSRFSKCWYAKYTDEKMETAKRLTGATAV